MKTITKKINGQTFIFDFRKLVYWKEKSSLILSDVHIGKITHFRKNGISLPSFPALNNLNTLKSAIQDYNPKEVIFLGDLFHSEYNSEWEEWLTFFKSLKLSFTLVIGNHDSIKFKLKGLKIFKYMLRENLYFSHYPIDNLENFNFCGHIHPSFIVKGIGKQKIKLPCFYLSKTHLIFPSFGEFTGTHNMKLQNIEDEIFLLSKERIFKLK